MQKRKIEVELDHSTIRKIEALAFLKGEEFDVSSKIEQMIDVIATGEILKELGIADVATERLDRQSTTSTPSSERTSLVTQRHADLDEDFSGHSVSSDDDAEQIFEESQDSVSDESDDETDESNEAPNDELTNEVTKYLEELEQIDDSVPPKEKQTISKPVGYKGSVPARKLGLSSKISNGAKVSALTFGSSGV